MIRPAMRPELPAGTVTFLFTDVEGSTRLLHELGAEAYAEALAEHRRVIREACAARRRRRGRHAGRRLLLRVPDRARRARGRASDRRRLEPARSRCASALHTGTPLLDRGGLRRRRRPPRGPHRRRRARRPGARVGLDRGAARRGPRCSISASTASRTWPRPSASTSSATATFPPLKTLYRTNLPSPRPARRPRARARGGARAALPTTSACHPHRPGRDRKTRLALAAAAEVSDLVPGRRLVGCRSLRCAIPRSSSRRRAAARREGRASRHLGDKRDALLSSTTSSR